MLVTAVLAPRWHGDPAATGPTDRIPNAMDAKMALLAAASDTTDPVERVAIELTNHLGQEGARRAALSNHWLGVVQAIDRLPPGRRRDAAGDRTGQA